MYVCVVVQISMIGFVMTPHVKETNGMYSIQIVVFISCKMMIYVHAMIYVFVLEWISANITWCNNDVKHTSMGRWKHFVI
jgi:hypothetical protein